MNLPGLLARLSPTTGQSTASRSSTPSGEAVETDQKPGRIVVLASGGGTNCQALIDACAAGELDARVVAVITNRSDAGVIDRADAAGIRCHVIEHAGKDPEVRRLADARLIDLIASCDPDLVVMAGWMRILGSQVGASFPMINLHPAKPGEFPGIRSIERAYDAWCAGEIKESGVMVHWVPDDGVDAGPVILTEVVPFHVNDGLADFAARLHVTEHRLLVAATTKALTHGSHFKS
jgi:phosphoribosylglycinamide formyltransferase-1